MERNWYAVYTKPQRERKISNLLTSKGIENFYPVNHLVTGKMGQKKRNIQPLIDSFVFVYLSEAEFKIINRLPDVNLVYWMSKPAMIQEEEIDMIKNLSANYVNMQLEKVPVRFGQPVTILEGHVNSFLDSSRSFSNHPLKVSLPSLGYIVVAEKEKVVRETSVVPESAPFSLFPRRLNALFTN